MIGDLIELAGEVKKIPSLSLQFDSQRLSTIGRQGLRQDVELLETSFKHKSPSVVGSFFKEAIRI
jgi:hypothetical protein